MPLKEFHIASLREAYAPHLLPRGIHEVIFSDGCPSWEMHPRSAHRGIRKITSGKIHQRIPEMVAFHGSACLKAHSEKIVLRRHQDSCSPPTIHRGIRNTACFNAVTHGLGVEYSVPCIATWTIHVLRRVLRRRKSIKRSLAIASEDKMTGSSSLKRPKKQCPRL